MARPPITRGLSIQWAQGKIVLDVMHGLLSTTPKDHRDVTLEHAETCVRDV